MAGPLDRGELEAQRFVEVTLEQLKRSTGPCYAVNDAQRIIGVSLGYGDLKLLDRLRKLPRLDVLRLYQAGLQGVPAAVQRLTQLRALYLGSNNHLSDLPDLRHFECLETLGLNGTRVPLEGLRLPESLRRLSLANTMLPEFPRLDRLPPLTHLYLGSNPISTIPARIESDGSLRTLNLARTQLRDLGGLLNRLRSLEDVDFSFTALRHVDASPLVGLRRLSVHGCSNLDQLEFGSARKLEGLDLGSTRLVSIPAEIGPLPVSGSSTCQPPKTSSSQTGCSGTRHFHWPDSAARVPLPIYASWRASQPSERRT